LGGRPVSEKDDFGALLLGDSIPSEGRPARRPPDMCVVALQEIVELSVGNIFLATDLEEEMAHAACEERVAKELERSGHRYDKVGSVGMVGLFLLVYVRQELADQVTDVDRDRVKTGVFNLAGNKGAVCLRFDFGGVSFSFLNVHLHSGRENQAVRNQDIDGIMRNAFQAFSTRGGSRAPRGNFGRESMFIASRHHVAFVLGDFNFRLDLPSEESVLEGEPLTWLVHDQLRKGLVTGLDDFLEADIDFNPSYRYHVGSDALDMRRLPAWCDRILHKARPGFVVHPKRYGCLRELCYTSDHRPVFADVEVEDTRRSLFVRQWSMENVRIWFVEKSMSFLAKGDTCGHFGGMCNFISTYMEGCCCRSSDMLSAVEKLRSPRRKRSSPPSPRTAEVIASSSSPVAAGTAISSDSLNSSGRARSAPDARFARTASGGSGRKGARPAAR